MQKITPFLWFDNQAEEAMNFYTSLFKNSEIGSVARYGEAGPGPGGSIVTATFKLAGLEVTALNGGPHFKFTPATSFFVLCETEDEIDTLWANLSEGGQALMELAAYPFSEKFGWIEDKFGLSWQLNLVGQPQKIMPFLLFVGDQAGKAEEAMNFYTSLFDNASIIRLERHGPGSNEIEGSVIHAVFSLFGQEFMAMDSAGAHAFSFTEAVSFMVHCQSQAEVDELWAQLSADKEAEQCGWLKDKYGVSWQIIPDILLELMGDPDSEKAKRVTEAMLQMKKIDIAALQQAYGGDTQ
ncbi:MAG TPA: VOC family protein [Anaerolineae bacterium]|nr:VOC family protein [Anaerolineae bacterium]